MDIGFMKPVDLSTYLESITLRKLLGYEAKESKNKDSMPTVVLKPEFDETRPIRRIG